MNAEKNFYKIEKSEKKLEYNAENFPDYKWISGSNLYGTATSGSDEDIRGFLLPPFDYLIGIKSFKSIDLSGDDHKVYSLQYFLQLALKGDPLVTEGLFAPAKNIIRCSDLGKEVLKLRPHLVSNAIYNRIMGYSIGEWRKAMAIKIISAKKNKVKKDIINDIRSHWKLDKEKMDGVISILDSADEKKIVSSVAGLGAKRRQEVEEHGYCRKSAAHSIRLVTQLTELMLTGEIVFPRPNAKLLLEIRNGKYSKEKLEEIHNEVDNIAKETKKRSILPDKPDVSYVWETYEKMVVKQLS